MPTECTKCGEPLKTPGFLCPDCEKLQGGVHTLKGHVEAFIGERLEEDVSDANGEEHEHET